MDKRHLGANVWGRDKIFGDVANAISLVDNRRYRECLDIGAGLGPYAEIASLICAHVPAIDISDVATYRSRWRLMGLSNVSVQTANIKNSYSAENFDFVIIKDILY